VFLGFGRFWFRSFLVSTQGGGALNFRVKGQEYFLAFVEEERRWYVFAPTGQSVQRIPVYVDAASAPRAAVENGISKISR
jgi:hypothetical protein